MRRLLAFSQAVDTRCNRSRSVNVRPVSGIKECHSADTEPGMAEEEEEEEEGRAIKGQKPVYKPSKAEWDQHMRTHNPFRKWCPFCVRGRCKNSAHGGSTKTEEEIEQEVPVISMDYMGPKTKEDRRKEISVMPIIVGVQRKRKGIFAHMVTSKGHNAHAIKMVSREIRLTGYNRMIIKTDQEPAIKEVVEAVRRERPEEMELIPEESPVGEHEQWGDRACNPDLAGSDKSHEVGIAIQVWSDHSSQPSDPSMDGEALCLGNQRVQGGG